MKKKAKKSKVTAWTVKYVGGRLDPQTFLSRGQVCDFLRDAEGERMFKGAKPAKVELREI